MMPTSFELIDTILQIWKSKKNFSSIQTPLHLAAPYLTLQTQNILIILESMHLGVDFMSLHQEDNFFFQLSLCLNKNT